ncbi:malto-oligosyltrehalose synthase [Streptomyces capparidis]
MTTPPSPPTATYRVQLTPDFPFAAAADVVPYAAALGVSHLHLSPVLQAAPGSTHGYDVVDHCRVSAELGGEEGLRALARTAREHGLGLVLDIVPNHMGVPAPEHLNRPLWSVLRDGPSSPFARWFDIEWEAHGGRVLMPFLGARLGEELGSLSLETLTLEDAEGRPREETILRYHDHTFPVRPGTEHLPLPELLRRQWYRLAWWRVAPAELNYRRFFTITGLIGLRAEDPEVFAATHAVPLRLIAEGVVDGLRVDHPDGLADPRGYLRRLADATGGRWTVVEKVLTGDEQLPRDWPCAGTTGYDALRRVDGLFVSPAGAAEVTGGYGAFTAADTGRAESWTETARRSSRELLAGELAAEVERLTRLAHRICAAEVALCDHAYPCLRTAVVELLASYPAYRPYVVPGEPAPDEAVRLMDAAADFAGYAFVVPEEAAAVDVVRDLALGALGRGPEKDEFAARFAQVCTAVRAKAVEDTAYYRWFPLLSLNEVGGEPGAPGCDPDEFHAFCALLQRDRPATGTALSTHDTKRSADVRARLAVLTEVPERWREWLARVHGAHAHRHRAGLPDRAAEYLVWQTLLGLPAPADPDRVTAAVRKSLREAGLRTNWTAPDPRYEEAVLDFAAAAATHASRAAEELLGDHAAAVRANVLGAALVHLTMPGVPDVYQGTESTRYDLVDPDNRRPVPFPELAKALARLDGGGGPDGLAGEKLRLTATALRLRRARPGWFGAAAGHTPVHARGPAAAHLVAFHRAGAVLPAVTRLSHLLQRAGGWRGTVLPLPEGDWTDALTGRAFTGPMPVAELLAQAPVALLVRDGAPAA